jgi:hypothetical protein
MEEQLQDASNVTPAALTALLVMAYLTWTLPRRYAVAPLLVMTCLMPLGQQMVVLGLHFQMFRILLLVGGLRVLARGEAARMKWTVLDKLFVWWVIVSVVFGSLSKPSSELFVNRAGDAFNAFGCYFFVRCVIVDFEDIVASVRILAIVSLPFAALMIVEKTTTHNLLSVFGGVPAITIVREGHLRCQGAFRHPILAGTFGATQFPFFIALWHYRRKHRRLAILGALSAVIIVLTASSSGALMALGFAIIGLALWKCRRHFASIRTGTLLGMLGMSVVMHAPIWYLMAKLGNVFGGTGWHRAYLIDQTIGHFSEWCLFGTTYTANWAPAGEVIQSDPNMMDITNHFVMEGVKGGLLKLVLFISMIVVCFKGVGRVLRVLPPKSPAGFFVWATGVSLFAHCVSFISITYFDQIIVVWFWLLAIISCLIHLQSVSPVYRPPVKGSQVGTSPRPLPAPQAITAFPVRRRA